MVQRKIVLENRNLGNYEIASLTWSFGDVLRFFDGNQKGVLIVDTCGHCMEYGNQMNRFLDRQIKTGLGENVADAKEFMRDLRKRTCLEIFGTENWPESFYEERLKDNWWGFNQIQYALLDQEKVSIAGIYSKIIKKEGIEKRSSERLGSVGHYHNNHDFEERQPYNSFLSNGEVLFMFSDGFDLNAGRKIKSGTLVSDQASYLIKRNLNLPTNGILNLIRKDLEKFYLPSDLENFLEADDFFDDVTFVLIKRKV